MKTEHTACTETSNPIDLRRVAERALPRGRCILSQCACRACFGFEFGAIHLTLDQEGIAQLARIVQRLNDVASREDVEPRKRYYLQLPGINIKLIFRQHELPVLNDLLGNARAWLDETALSSSRSLSVH